MCRIHSRFLFTLFFGCLASISLYAVADVQIAGSISLGYDLIEKDGDWSGEFEQRLNLGLRTRSGLGHLLGLNLGLVWHGKKFDFRRGISPTYSINLQGDKYSLSSGYSVRFNRGVIDTQLYENLSLFLPDLPTVRVVYTRQGSRDTAEERRVDTSGNNIQFGVEDTIGPFRIMLNRREYSTEDKLRGPQHDVRSDSNAGDVTFARSFGPMLSVNGRYGLERLSTERASTGRTEGETEDFSLGFRLSPIRTIVFSGTRAGRQEERESFLFETAATRDLPPVTRRDYVTDRFQLTLQPLDGIRLGAAYSTSDDTREEGRNLSDESRSLTVNLVPLRRLTLSGRFIIRDSQENGKISSTIRRNSFDIHADPRNWLKILTRLDRSKLTDFVNELDNDRDSVTVEARTTVTENLRADMSYNWQKSIKRFEEELDVDRQHRLGVNFGYSFARMLNLNFRVNRNISRARGSDTTTSVAISYVEERSRLGIRYNRASSPVKSSSLIEEGRRVAQTFATTFSYEVNQNTELSLIYQGRIGSTGSGSSGEKRISFRLTARF